MESLGCSCHTQQSANCAAADAAHRLQDVLGGRAWKGRSPLLADVVRLRLCYASGDGNHPAAQILELATGHLSQVGIEGALVEVVV